MITTITINIIIVTTANTIIIIITRQVWQAQNPPALAPPRAPTPKILGPSARGRGHRMRNHHLRLLLYFSYHPHDDKHHGEILFSILNFIFLITTKSTYSSDPGALCKLGVGAACATTTYVFIFSLIFIITTTLIMMKSCSLN